eukprot:4999928-Pleurochrysis_carterae.AAC.2
MPSSKRKDLSGGIYEYLRTCAYEQLPVLDIAMSRLLVKPLLPSVAQYYRIKYSAGTVLDNLKARSARQQNVLAYEATLRTAFLRSLVMQARNSCGMIPFLLSQQYYGRASLRPFGQVN